MGAIFVHAVVVICGVVAVAINSDVSVLAQLSGAAVIFVWTFATSSIVWYLLKLSMGVRVSDEQEYEGVDVSECGIVAYPEFDSK